MGRSVDDWLASSEDDEWSQMMRKVAAFHHKHDFAGNNGHDMGYRIALTVEELGELAAAITKGKPIEKPKGNLEKLQAKPCEKPKENQRYTEGKPNENIGKNIKRNSRKPKENLGET